MGMHNNIPLIMNMGNSIIGVAVLAMPYCFQQCGILLGMLLLLFCTWLTLVSCKLLMKAGIKARRRSYEFLAYHTHGAPGKFITEIGMIGMQFGTLIAQMVIIGDLGPSIVSKVFGLANFPEMRTFLIIVLGLSVGLPMGLLKDLRAVSKASTVCIICYSVYVFYVIGISLPNLVNGDWFADVNFWRTKGLFRCLPIFSFSFGCQSQLFILYDALPEPSLKVISSVTNSAVNLCAAVYLLVGFLGYISYHTHDIPGDIINIFPITPATDATKLAFVISTVITFPVIIYPCRSSIYTLFFAKPSETGVSCPPPPPYHKQDSEVEEVFPAVEIDYMDYFLQDKSKPHDDFMAPNAHMPERLFKLITVGIVLSSMIVSIMIPNVELILGINGAIMGTLICYIFPALFYLKVMGNSSEDRNKAQFLLFAGITILLVSTMATLRPPDKGHSQHHQPSLDLINRPTVNPLGQQNDAILPQTPPALVPVVADNQPQANDGRRKEPPNPDPPDKVAQVKPNIPLENQQPVNVEKRDKEKAQEEALRVKELELKEKKQDDLIAKLEQQRVEQEKLIEQQKQLIQEFKLHHQQDMKEKDKDPQNSQAGQPLANQQEALQQQANQQQALHEQANQQQANQQQSNQQEAMLKQANPQQELLPTEKPLQANPLEIKAPIDTGAGHMQANPNLNPDQAPANSLDIQAQPVQGAVNQPPLANNMPEKFQQNLIPVGLEPIEKHQPIVVDEGLRIKRDTNQTVKEGVKAIGQVADSNVSANNASAEKQPLGLQNVAGSDNKALTPAAVPEGHDSSTNQMLNVQTVKIPSSNPEMRRRLRSLGDN